MKPETGQAIDLLNFVRQDVPSMELERFFKDHLTREHGELVSELFGKLFKLQPIDRKAPLARLEKLKEKVMKGEVGDTGHDAYADPMYLIRELEVIKDSVGSPDTPESLENFDLALKNEEPPES